MTSNTPDSSPFFSKVNARKLVGKLDQLGISRSDKLLPLFATECILEILSMHDLELYGGLDSSEIKILAIQKILALRGLACNEIFPATIVVAERLVITRDMEMTN